MAKDRVLGNSDVRGQAVPLKCHRAKDGMTQKPSPAEEGLLSLSPVRWPLPLFSGFSPFLSGGRTW